jgi:hypothetical protein
MERSRREDLIVVRALEQCDADFRKAVWILLGLFGSAWGLCAYILFGLCAPSGTVLALMIVAVLGVAAVRTPRLAVRASDNVLEVRDPWRNVSIPWSALTGVGWCVYPTVGPLSTELYCPAFFVSGRRLPVVVPVRNTTIAARLGIEPDEAIRALETDARRFGLAYHERVPDMSPGMLTNLVLAAAIGLPVVVILVGTYVCRLPI